MTCPSLSSCFYKNRNFNSWLLLSNPMYFSLQHLALVLDIDEGQWGRWCGRGTFIGSAKLWSNSYLSTLPTGKEVVWLPMFDGTKRNDTGRTRTRMRRVRCQKWKIPVVTYLQGWARLFLTLWHHQGHSCEIQAQGVCEIFPEIYTFLPV